MSPMCGKLFRKLHFHPEDQMNRQDAKNAKQTDHQSPITSHPATRYHCGLCDQLADPKLPLTLSRHAPKCPQRTEPK
jgi:hypothetical protein